MVHSMDTTPPQKNMRKVCYPLSQMTSRGTQGSHVSKFTLLGSGARLRTSTVSVKPTHDASPRTSVLHGLDDHRGLFSRC